MSAAGSELSRVLRLAEIEGRGRGLVASEALRGGQIVLRESPIVLYSALPLIKQSSSSTYNNYCANCFRTFPNPKSTSVPCPGCLNHHLFCSQNCLSLALKSSHSPWICQSLSRLRDCPSLLLEHPVERQVQARFLVAAYHLALVSLSQFQTLLSLQGSQSDPTDTAAAQFLHALISSVCPPIPGFSFSVELTAALLTKDKLNAFGLMEPFSFSSHDQRSVRAYGIYPNASFFNHDCLPNACRFDYVDTNDTNTNTNNTDIIVRMIHDVPQGREICLSYFPVNLNYSSRQTRLLDDYGFTCHCDRCKVEANWSDHEDENDDDHVAEDEDEKNEDDLMVMDEDHTPPSSSYADTDFPHAYFFLKYMCERQNCWGTLAPLTPKDDATPSHVMECNVCGNLKNDQLTDADADADAAQDQLFMDD